MIPHGGAEGNWRPELTADSRAKRSKNCPEKSVLLPPSALTPSGAPVGRASQGEAAKETEVCRAPAAAFQSHIGVGGGESQWLSN